MNDTADRFRVRAPLLTGRRGAFVAAGALGVQAARTDAGVTLDPEGAAVSVALQPDDDAFDGVARVLAAVVGGTTWTTPSGRPTVALVGMPCWGPSPTADVDGLFRGTPFARGPAPLVDPGPAAGGTAAASVAVLMPHARPVMRPLAGALQGRKVIAADLPMGTAATRRLVLGLADAVGLPAARITPRLDQVEAATAEHLASLGHHAMRNLRAAVVADAPSAAGLTSALQQLGVAVVHVATLDKHLGGPGFVRGLLGRDGVTPAGDLRLDDRPSHAALRDTLLEQLAGSRVDLVFAPADVLAMLRHGRHGLAALKGGRLVPFGLPSTGGLTRWFGHGGVRALAEVVVRAALAPRPGGRPRPLARPPGRDRHPTPEQEATTERYALKGMHLAKMTGISVGAHAMKDGFLLQHVGVGCKYKAAAQVAVHDWGSHPNKKEAWTQVGEVALIQGSGKRIGPFARTWYERRRPGFMLLVSAYFIELTGEDIKDLVDGIEATLPCPLAYLNTAAPNGGFYDGYAATMRAVLDKLDFKAPATAPTRVSTVGFFFHRYEHDHVVELAELRRLITASGHEPGPILFSGVPYADLASAAESGVVLKLPYARPGSKKLARRLKKRDVREAPLPIGAAGTAALLRALGADDAADAALADLTAQADAWRDRLDGTRVAVFADTPLAVGLTVLLRELGATPVLVATRDVALGGVAALTDDLGAQGHDLAGVEVWEQPSLRRIRKELVPRALDGAFDVVIGSSTELGTFKRDPRTKARRASVALVEVGFPSTGTHTPAHQPLFGAPGIAAWGRLLVEAIGAAEAGDRVALP